MEDLKMLLYFYKTLTIQKLKDPKFFKLNVVLLISQMMEKLSILSLCLSRQAWFVFILLQSLTLTHTTVKHKLMNIAWNQASITKTQTLIFTITTTTTILEAATQLGTTSKQAITDLASLVCTLLGTIFGSGQQSFLMSTNPDEQCYSLHFAST